MGRIIIAALALVVLLSGSAFATDPIDINIDIDNTNNVSATGGNANAEQHQNQDQKQKQEQQQDAHSSATVFSTREHTTSVPGVVGGIAPLAAIVPDGKWHVLLCDQYTVAELKNMKDSSSYVNREGFFLKNLFTSPLDRTLRVKKVDGEISDDSTVRLVPDDPGNRTLATYEGSGAIGAPLDAIIAYAALEGVYDTNEYSLVVTYRARDIAKLTGFGIGSGAAGAVSSSDSARSGSMSVGAIIGSSEAYAKYVYDVRVKVVRASAAALAAARYACFPPPPATPVAKKDPVPEPTPPKEICNPSSLLIQIERWEEACKHCGKPCFNNLRLRKGMGDTYIDLWKCTGDKGYLEKAIKEYEKAERDFLKGREPDGVKTKKLKGAQGVMYDAYYNWSLAIRETKGRDAQIRFAQQKGLKKMPSAYQDLKR